jgi:hypothetical protein
VKERAGEGGERERREDKGGEERKRSIFSFSISF